MLIIKHTIETQASPESIWKIWQDVENWNTWDHGIEYSKIFGPFKTDTPGELKPKGGPLVKTLLKDVIPFKEFTDEAKLFFAKIVMKHSIFHSDGKTSVTHQIEMKGILSPFFAFVIGRDMKKNLPQEMSSMIKKAELLENSHS